MKLGRALLATSILLLSALAGCISKGGEETPPTIETSAADDGVLEANESTVAPDGRGQIAAFEETNKTEVGTGGMEHTHDYWKGAERLESVAWIDSGLIPIPFAPCNKVGGGCTVGGTTPNTDTYPVGTAIADYDLAPPPEMGMIYEGTKQVELKLVKLQTLSACAEGVCTPEAPANPLGTVHFDYIAANDEPGAFRTGGELKLNEPFLIDIEPTMADMPHQTKSLWIFRVYSNSEMVTFEFNISISLVKGYDVVDWPPHPDLYADRTERSVFDGAVHLASAGSVDGLLFGSDAGWTSPDRVISWNTDRVEVDFANVAFAAQVPVPPKGFLLQFRNASTPFLMGNGVAYGGQMDDPGSDGTSYHFVIDLAGDRGDAYDTPYAQHSRWGFRLVPYWEGDAVTGEQCIDELFFPGILFGCQWYPWEMDYTMTVKAFGHAAAPEAAPTA